VNERRFRVLSAGFCATVALFARASHAVPASSLVVDGHRCTIVGTAGPDALAGTSGPDVICGLGGADRIDGGGGNDVLIGGAGNDTLEGNLGHDTLLGGAGADSIDAWDGARDRIDGGAGIDRAWVDHALDMTVHVERFG
jgi:Ca2+-binding RTX toxin-like protein